MLSAADLSATSFPQDLPACISQPLHHPLSRVLLSDEAALLESNLDTAPAHPSPKNAVSPEPQDPWHLPESHTSLSGALGSSQQSCLNRDFMRSKRGKWDSRKEGFPHPYRVHTALHTPIQPCICHKRSTKTHGKREGRCGRARQPLSAHMSPGPGNSVTTH